MGEKTKYLTRQEELILLAIMQLKDNAYLVTVRDYLIKITGKEWTLGAIYVPLDRLTRAGYLATRIGEPNAKRGRNEIKYYNLTKRAVEALNEIKKVNESLWTGFSDMAYNI